MSHIYRNLPEIFIPSQARVNKGNAQISIYYKLNGKRRRTVIGYATQNPGKMVANDNFKFHFPQLWNSYYQEEQRQPAQVHAGLYALTLGIATQCGLYEDLQHSFGPQFANAVLDFADYQIRFRTSTAMHFDEEMANQMRFTRELWSDSKYSSFFTKEISEDAINKFKIQWLNRCADSGTSDLWLCVDGSNNDCSLDDSDLAEPGHAKSLKQSPIVGYMWAVDARTGMPITYFEYSGSIPDCKAVKQVIQFLASSKMKVKGLIMDRGFASKAVCDLAEQNGIGYVIMLKSNTMGFVQMMKKHSEKIRWSISHLVNPAPIFGTTDRVKVFGKSGKPSCVALYLAGISGACAGKRVIEKLWDQAEAIREQIRTNPDKVSIPATMRKYLKLVEEDGKVKDVAFVEKACQGDIDASGYFAITSSETMSAREIYDLYQLRDVSEKQFSVFKSQLNCDTTRVHSDAAVKARLAVGFCASILRTHMELACRQMHLDTNKMIRKLDRAFFAYMPNGTYQAVFNLGEPLKKFLGNFGIQEAHFAKFAQEFNDYSNPAFSQVHAIPALEPQVRKGRGRVKGSKNKKTLLKMALEAQAAARGIEPAPKRKPGRPKGSKNKSTLLREAREAKQPPKVKRAPGRPKGSKNKKTLAREARAAAAAKGDQIKRGRGRPKGSKNKSTLEKERAMVAANVANKT